MNQLPTVVVEELDVSVLLRRDGDGERGVAEDFVDLTGSIWFENKNEKKKITIFAFNAESTLFL